MFWKINQVLYFYCKFLATFGWTDTIIDNLSNNLRMCTSSNILCNLDIMRIYKIHTNALYNVYSNYPKMAEIYYLHVKLIITHSTISKAVLLLSAMSIKHEFESMSNMSKCTLYSYSKRIITPKRM